MENTCERTKYEVRSTRRGARLGAVSAVLLGVLAAACGSEAPAPVSEGGPVSDGLPDRPWVIAHRGASAYAPENTVPAFELAAEQGAEFVEIDIQLTSDGEIVVLHDVTLDRTTDVEDVFPDRSRPDPDDEDQVPHWWVDDFTIDELRRLDAGSWFGDEFAGTRIPTFDETIEALRGRSGIFIEIKSPERYPGIEAAMMTVLARHGLDTPGADPSTPIVIQSFGVPSIRTLAAEGVALPLHVLFSDGDADRWFSEEGLQDVASFATGISPAKGTLATHADRWRRATELNLPLTPWTFRASDVPEAYETVTDEMQVFLDAGAAGVITDNPDLAP